MHQSDGKNTGLDHQGQSSSWSVRFEHGCPLQRCGQRSSMGWMPGLFFQRDMLVGVHQSENCCSESRRVDEFWMERFLLILLDRRCGPGQCSCAMHGWRWSNYNALVTLNLTKITGAEFLSHQERRLFEDDESSDMSFRVTRNWWHHDKVLYYSLCSFVNVIDVSM
jgi:hypothetical protein